MKLDKEFKIRCSAIGKIMTNPRAKKDLLSQTTISYVEDWIKEQLYNRKKEFSNKYTSKGLIVEDDSIDVLTEFDKAFPPYIKNEEYFENDFLTGTPDLILDDTIIDIKSSYDCFTFPLFATEIDNKEYFYQLQGYMYLTGKKHAKLAYILSDTPMNIITKEAWSLVNNNGYDLETAVDIMTAKHTYSDIPINLRVKTFEIEYDEEVVNAIIERVKLIREYIKTIEL